MINVIFLLAPTLHPWHKPPLVIVYNSFYILLNSTFRYFVKDFWVYIHEGYWSVVFFFCMSFSGFGICVILTSQYELGSALSSSVLGKRLYRIGVSFSLN